MTVNVQILRFGWCTVFDEKFQRGRTSLLFDQFGGVNSHIPIVNIYIFYILIQYNIQ